MHLVAPEHIAPNFDFVALAYQHQFFFKLPVVAQHNRQKHAPLRVQGKIGCMADEQSLQQPGLRTDVGKPLELTLDNFPLRQRIHEQAFFPHVDGHHQVAVAAGQHRLAKPRGHGQAAFTIQGGAVDSAKHDPCGGIGGGDETAQRPDERLNHRLHELPLIPTTTHRGP